MPYTSWTQHSRNEGRIANLETSDVKNVAEIAKHEELVVPSRILFKKSQYDNLTTDFERYNSTLTSPPVGYAFSVSATTGVLQSTGPRSQFAINIGTKFKVNSPTVKVRCIVRLDELPIDSTTLGFCVGLISTNQTAGSRQSSIILYQSLETTAQNRKLRVYTATPAGIPASTSGTDTGGSILTSEAFLDVAVNDLFTVELSIMNDVLTATVRQQRTNVLLSLSTSSFSKVNAARVFLFHQGGSYSYLQTSVEDAQSSIPKIICLGDSKTRGHGASTPANYYPNVLQSILQTKRGINIYAGGGDQSLELLNALPFMLANIRANLAVLCIGRNDLSAGLTWELNYTKIVQLLYNAKITVVHLLPIPEITVSDQSTIVNFVRTHYSLDIIVDPSVGWSNALYLSGDNIHPNNAGYAFIADKVADAIYNL